MKEHVLLLTSALCCKTLYSNTFVSTMGYFITVSNQIMHPDAKYNKKCKSREKFCGVFFSMSDKTNNKPNISFLENTISGMVLVKISVTFPDAFF